MHTMRRVRLGFHKKDTLFEKCEKWFFSRSVLILKKCTLKININFFKTVFRNFMFLKYMGCIVLELGIFEVKKVKPLHCLGT